METLTLDDFNCQGCSDKDVMVNLSRHCNLTPSDEIAIYGSPNYKYLICKYDSITYPKVVYVDKLDLGRNATLVNVLPDIKKIGTFWPDAADTDDFGNILEIDLFAGMSIFFDPMRRDYFNIETTCEPLGNKMYRFTSKKGSWDIKVNRHN
jgi:hypothetical protein